MTSHASLRLTPDARRWALDKGGVITLRPSHRAGCCGGGALVPIAEVGVPKDSTSHLQYTVDGVTVYAAPNLRMDGAATITIALVNFLGWRRLIVEGLDIDSPRAERN